MDTSINSFNLLYTDRHVLIVPNFVFRSFCSILFFLLAFSFLFLYKRRLTTHFFNQVNIIITLSNPLTYNFNYFLTFHYILNHFIYRFHSMQESLDNILNQIKAKHRSFQVQSNRHEKPLNSKQDDSRQRVNQVQSQGYVPKQLIKGNKGNFNWFLIHGRNSYSIYPIIEQQTVKKKRTIYLQSFRLKTDNIRICSSKQKVQKVKKLPYLKSGNKKPGESTSKRNQSSGTIIKQNQALRNLNFLQKALKVHRKVISTIPSKIQSSWEVEGNVIGKQGWEIKRVGNKGRKLLAEEGEGEICSWKQNQELQNSFQTLIF